MLRRDLDRRSGCVVLRAGRNTFCAVRFSSRDYRGGHMGGIQHIRVPHVLYTDIVYTENPRLPAAGFRTISARGIYESTEGLRSRALEQVPGCTAGEIIHQCAIEHKAGVGSRLIPRINIHAVVAGRRCHIRAFGRIVIAADGYAIVLLAVGDKFTCLDISFLELQ